MSKNKEIHVVPNKNAPKEQKWAVKKEGVKTPLATAETKKEAKDIGREIAKKDKVELIDHKLDGTIGDRNSYGNDPEKSKG